MFLREFLKGRDLGDKAEFVGVHPHPFLLEEGVFFVGGNANRDRELHYLDPQSPLVAGRKAPADIRITGDPSVSGRHVQFLPPSAADAPWQILDLGSTNGTFVNGARLDAHAPTNLHDESVVGIGPSKSFVFLHSATFLAINTTEQTDLHAKSGPHRPTEPLGRSQPLSTSVGRDVTTRAPEAGLYLFCGPYEPFPIEPGQTVIIGRSTSDADFVLPHPAVSRQHAELVYLEDGFVIRDLGSSNGVFIEQEQVGSRPVELPIGQRFRVGDFRLVVLGKPVEADSTYSMDRGAMKNTTEMDLEELPLAALLETVEKKLKSGCLKVMGEGCEGDIVFHAGKPIEAETKDGLRGVEAIRRLLEVETGTVLIDPNAREVGDRKIELSFGQILKG